MVIEFRADVPSAIEFHGYKPSEHAPVLSAVPVVNVIGGTTQDRVDGDATFHDIIGGTSTYEAQIVASEIVYSYASLNPAIVDPDTSGYCAYKGVNGSTRVVAQAAHAGASVNVSVSQTVEPSSSQFLSYNVGSLAKAMNDLFDSAMAAPPDVQNSKQLFQSSNPPYQSTWNQFCWAIKLGVKLWPICTYKDDVTEASNWGGATAVHQRFAVIADHYAANYQPGRVLGWTQQNGTFVTRTVTATQQINSDFAMVRLDSDLPSEIGFARVLPDNWQQKMTSIPSIDVNGVAALDQSVCIPAIWRTKNNLASCLEWFIQKWNSADGQVHWLEVCASSEVPTHANRWPYYTSASSGDSGNGVCLIHPQTKDLILLFAQLGGSGGTSVLKNKAAANAWMNSQVAGASLTDADFSMYPTYT